MTILEQLPTRMDRLELQIVQLREEVRVEFSAMRGEMAAGDEGTRRSLREEIRAGDEETRRVLREEIRAGDDRVMATLSARIEDARRETRVLHEDALARIAVLGEGLASLSEKVDRNDAALSQAIEASHADTRAMFERVLSRLPGRTIPETRRRGKKR